MIVIVIIIVIVAALAVFHSSSSNTAITVANTKAFPLQFLHPSFSCSDTNTSQSIGNSAGAAVKMTETME